MKTNTQSKFGLILLLAFGALALLAPTAWAQANGDFRSIMSGDWNSTSTWERYNGTTWVGGLYPTNQNAGVVTIQNTHTVTVTGAVTSDQVTIDSGGQVTVNSGVTWTINDPTGTDLTVNGTLNVAGTLGGTGGPQMVVAGTVVNSGSISLGAGSSITFNADSLYQHTQNGGTVPTATWNATATCEILGTTTTAPSGLGQTFGHFTWNCASQTAALNINALTAVNGNCTVTTTGSGSLAWVNANATKTIGGNLNIQDGTFTFCITGTGGRTLTVTGDLNLSGGTFDFCTSGAGTPVLNLAGNYNQTSGTFQNSSGVLTVNFTGSGKTFTQSSGTLTTANMNFNVNNAASLTLNNSISTGSSRNFTVATGGTLNCGTSIINGSGAFTNSAGATLGIGSVDGITSSGVTGNIQATTRTFNSAGSYIYNGTSAQVTGDGLPSPAANVTVNNTSGVTLSGAASVTNLTIGAGATLDASVSNYGISVARSWTNDGTFTAQSGIVTFGGSVAQTIAGSATTAFYDLTIANIVTNLANLDVAGTMDVSSGGTFIPAATAVINNSAAQGTLSGSGTIQVTRVAATADLVSQYKFSTYTLGSLNAAYNGAGSQTINSTATVGNYGSLTNSGGGTKTLDGDVVVTGSLGIVAGTTLDASASNYGLTVGGTWTGAGTFTPQNGTVTLNGGAQTVNTTTTFCNLTLAGSGAKSLPAVTTIRGNLTLTDTATASLVANLTIGGALDIGSTAALGVGGINLNVTNTTTISGWLTNNATAGTKVFVGDVIVNSGVWTNSVGEAITFVGNLQNDGIFAAGTGIQTFSGSGKTWSGTNGLNLPTVVLTGTYQNNTTLTIGTLNTSTGTLTQGAGATLNYAGGAGTFDCALVATASGNIVNYNGAAQDVKATSYNDLIISGSGTKTLIAAITNGGDMTVSAGTLDLATFTANRATLGGTFTLANGTTLLVGGAANFPANYSTVSLGATSTVNYDMAGAQTVSAQAYGNLTISGSNVKTLAGTATIAGDLTISAGTLDLSTFTADRTSSGGVLTLANAATAILKIGGTGTMPANFATHSIGAASTVDYSGAAQTVSAETYGNLTTSGSDTKTLASGTTAIAGILTIGTGTTFDAGANDFSITGNWVNNGTFTANAPQTVTFTGTGSPTIGGSATTTFNSLTINKSGGTATANADFTVASVFTIQAGTFAGSTRTITLAGAGTPFVVNGTFTVNTSTIKYTSAAGASVTGTSYYNLTLDSSGQTFTAAGDMTVSKVLTVAVDTSFDASSRTINLTDVTSGATPFVVNGTFVPSTSTVFYNNTATTADNIAGLTYYNLTMAGNGAADTFTAAGDMTIQNVLTIGTAANATFNASSRTVTLSGAGTPLVLSGTFTPATSTVRYTSATGANVTGGLTYNNLTLDSSGQTFTAAGNITNSSVMTIAAGTTFDASSRTIVLSGSGTPLVVTGTLTPSTSTVIYTSTTGATVGAANYNNLSFTGTGLFSLGGSIGIAGTCTVASGNQLSCGTSVIGGAGTFTLASGGNLQIGSTDGISASAASGNVQTATRNFNPGARYIYNGAGAQITGDGLPSSIAILTNNNSAGLTLSADLTVTNTLALTSGKITTGANAIIIPAVGSTIVGASSANYIVGNLQKAYNTGSGLAFTYTVGDSTTYAPVAVGAMTVTVAGSVRASTTSGEHPDVANSGINPAKDVNRYWVLTASGITASTYNITNTFVAGDVDGGANTSLFVVRRYNGSTWATATTGTRTATSASATGLSAFSDFAVGEQLIDHYVVTGPSPNSAGVPFTNTVTAQDILNQTVTGDSNTVVTMTSTGSAQFDSNNDDVFGDNTKTLVGGTFTIRTKDNVGETITITATDSNSKTGSQAGVVINAAAGAFRTAASGDWNSTSTWETFDGASWFAATNTPVSTNGVITIQSGHTVTVTAGVTVDQVIVQSGGQVNVNSGVTLTLANGAGTDLEVFGIVQNAGIVTINTGADLVFQSGGKYQHNFTTTAGTIPAATWANGSTCEVIGYTSNTGTLAGFGQAYHNLTWNCPSQTVTMNLGVIAATVNGDFIVTTTGSGSIVLGNSISVVSNLTVSAGTLDLATLTANRTTSGGTLTLANGATLRLSGASNFPANYATHSLGASSTVDYYSAGNQTIAVDAYGNLTLSGTTTIKALQTGTTIAGDLTLTGSPSATTVEAMSIGGDLDISGGTLTVAGFDFSVAGTTTISGGSLVHSSATGAKTHTGLVTVSGGTWNNSGNAAINFRGGLTVSSGTFTAGSGIYTFDTNDQAITGTVTIPNVMVTTVNLTNNSALTVTTALDGSGTLINDATGTLNVNFTGSVGIATLTADTSGNTVNYGAAGAQTVVPVAYHNLTLSGSGAKTMTGVTTIGGDLTLSGSATMTGNAGFTVTGTLSYGSSGSSTLTGATPVSVGKLSQTAGTLVDNGNTITVTGTGVNTWVKTAGTFTTTGATIFNGAAPQIGAANFNHVNIAGTAAASTTGAVTIAGNLDVASGASLSVGGFAFTVSGATSVSGTLNHASITSTKTFTGDVTIAGGGLWTNGVNEIVAFGGNLTNNGTFVSGTAEQTFAGVGKHFAGTSGLTVTLAVVDGSYTNTITMNVASFNTSTGTFTQGENTTLNYGGAGGTFDCALVATASGNTVNYNASGTQTAKPTAYYHLTLSGTSAKALTGITSIAGDLTVSNSANIAGNAAFTVTGVFNYSSSGTTTLTGSSPISVGTFNQTAGTIIDNGNTITVTGTGANTWTMTGTFTPTGTVVFTGAAPQIGASNFRNLTINVGSGNTATLTGAITTTGTLTINTGTTLADGGFTITCNGGVANNGTHSGAGKISLTGGAAAHTLSGAGNYANLEMNDANGATLTGSPTVNDTLTFITGRITTGANSLILPNSATVSGAGAGAYVAGNLQRAFVTGAGQSYTFAIGGAANYAPINLTGMDVTTGGDLTASTTDGDHANLAGSGISAVDGVNRYWTLTAGGLAISTCDATYNFVAADLDAGADTTKFFVRRYSGGTWFTTTLGTRTATSISITGLTGFSDFAAGEQGIDHYQVTASSPQTAGATFTTTVTAQDALNETVVEDSSTVVTMTSSTGNAQYDGNGDATFGDNTKTLTAGTFTIDTKDNVAETVNLIATDTDSKTGTRTGLVIIPEAAQYLAFSTQPGAATAGSAFGTQPVVKTRDQFGNDSTIGLAANANVTVALTAGAGPLQGTTTLDIGTAAGNGTATFTDLQIDVAGNDKQLTASATDFTNAVSSVFSVDPAAASTIEIVTEPSSTATAGVAFAQQPVVRLKDAFSNICSNDSATVVTATRNAGSGTLQGTTNVTAVNGYIAYTDLAHNVATTISIDFNSGALTPATSANVVVSHAAADKLTIQTQPSTTATAGIAFAQQPVVRIEDQFGNLIDDDNSSTVTATREAGSGVLQGTTTMTVASGVATFTDLSHNVATNITILFTSGSLTNVTSDLVTIIPGPAYYLGFTTQPADAVTYTPFGTQPVVRSQDQFGNDSTVDLPGNLDVTVALTAGTGPLQGTATFDIGTNVGNGTVTFTNLQIDVTGADKQLTASATDMTNAVSSVFTVGGNTTGTVTSSLNPALPGSNVTFTVTMSTVAPATGTPTGNVQFVIDGSPFGSPVALVSGEASIDNAALAHGYHTVAAEYAGDTGFTPVTNGLSPDQLINTPPVAGEHTLGAVQNTAIDLSATKLLTTDIDADGDAMSITNVSAASAQGGTVLLSGVTITYTPPTDYLGDDSFTYTLLDTFGATNTGTVNVTVRSETNAPQRVVEITALPDNNVLITFAGIPGRSYDIQATTNIAIPDWTTIGSTNASTNGLFWFADLEATNYTSRYYRSFSN